MRANSNRVNILGAPLSLLNSSQLLSAIGEAIESGSRITVLSGNVHAYNLAYEQTWLREFFNQADYVRLDGAGVRLGACLLGHRTPPRMTWADFGWSLAEFAAANHFNLFFLGSKAGVAEIAAEKLKEKYPGLSVAGCHHGYFDKSPGSHENEAMIEMIKTAKPDMLLVGFGMPLQEQWIKENYDQLSTHVIFTVGAAFDYLSGELTRPPKWMTDHGFEWLGRMLIEPKRLWKRYVIGNPLFLWRVIKQRLRILSINN